MYKPLHSSDDAALHKHCAAANAFQPGDIIRLNEYSRCTDNTGKLVVLGMTHAWRHIGHRFYVVSLDSFNQGDLSFVQECAGDQRAYTKIGSV